MASHLTRGGNRSASFDAFLKGVEKLCAEAGIATGAESTFSGRPSPQEGSEHQLTLL